MLQTENWFDYFDERYTEISSSNQHVIYQIYQNFYRIIIREAPEDEVSGDLFCTCAAIFSVEKLLESTQNHIYSTHMLTHRLKELIGILEEIPVTIHGTTGEHTDMLIALKNRTTSLLSDDGDYFQYIYTLYQIVWSNHLHKDYIVDEYIDKLETWVQKGVRGDLLHYELAHLYFLKQDDLQTIEQIKLIEQFDMRIPFSWAFECAYHEQWDRMRIWMDLMELVIAAEIEDGNGFSIQTIIHTYLEIFERYSEYIGNDAYEHTLETLLPYSFYPYCHHLLRQHQFKKWVEIHIALDRNPFRDDNSVEYLVKHGNEYLIPIYHFYIEESIMQKDRDGYKEAASMLEQLKMLYADEDQIDIWNHYIDLLTKQYKRLRAFQEELKKGGII